jgi:hypothetical protein
MISENLDTFLSDFGVPVIAGSVSGLGILDMPGTVIGDGLSISTERTVLVKASLFGSLIRNADITVNATAYKVRQVLPEDDASFVRITLGTV